MDSRAAVDRNVVLAREEIDRKLQEERDDMDNKVRLLRADMDIRRQEERDKMDRMMREEWEKEDKDMKLEREHMDRTIELERIKNDCEKMHARVEMDQKLQEAREDMDLKAMVEHKTTIEQPKKKMKPCVDMDLKTLLFRVHAEGELSQDQKQYHGGRVGFMRFLKRRKVRWYRMVKNLHHQGYKWDSDLYYLDPTKEASDALVKMEGPEQLDELMQAHEGRESCDLYITNAASYSEIEDIGEEEYDLSSASSEEDGVDMTSDVTNNFKRERDSLGCRDMSDMNCKEAGSWQLKKQHTIEHTTDPA